MYIYKYIFMYIYVYKHYINIYKTIIIKKSIT